MALEIIVPKLGLTMEEATLVKWTKSPGETVAAEEIVLVLETDKVTYEMPSPGPGLLAPLVQAGSNIKVKQVVGYLAADQAELESLASEGPAEAAAPGKPDRAPAAAAEAVGTAPQGGRIFASPLARAMAAAHGLDLNSLSGTGPGGRIIKADIIRALESGPPPAATAPAPAAPGPAEPGLLTVAEEIPISGVRKVVFKNMHLSLQTQAQLTLETEASAKEMIRLRERLNRAAGPDQTKIGYNAVIIKALAQALKKHPRVNAGVDGEVIKVWREIHVGLAVDLGQGLIVPKVRQAGLKTIPEIQAELDRLIKLAKQGRLMPDDLALGTVTVTNLGAWDIDHFTPIVNHPESAILGVGRIVDKPVAREGQVVVEPRLGLSLSFDHRIIDGAPGAAFLKTVKDMLEEPLLML